MLKLADSSSPLLNYFLYLFCGVHFFNNYTHYLHLAYEHLVSRCYVRTPQPWNCARYNKESGETLPKQPMQSWTKRSCLQCSASLKILNSTWIFGIWQ